MQASHGAANRALSAHHHHQHHLHHTATFPNLLHRAKRAAVRHVPCRGASSAASFDADNRDSNSSSIEQLQLRWRLQSVQQRRQQEAPVPAQQLSSEETDMLWAGYSALEEQVEKHHRRHEALAAQLQELHAKLQAVQQQHQQPATTWQAASFLLFFLLFINFWALVANFQMGWGLPWMAAKPAGGLWFKQLLSYAVPFTNTAVVLIFCMQAVKAAWTCLKL